ncbi:MAG: AraC family ligand binding domain-containing protein [Streptosporangiales bacterium]|nr:AraC family ligand binding domain-containing protein [Streptosporangiales bacterium]
MPDWARYWRASSVPVEAMHAHFSEHVYHRHSHETYSFGVTEAGAQAFRCRRAQHVSNPGLVMAFNPDDPHDGHAGSEDGFTYRIVHIWPEYFADLADSPLPLFRDPVIDDPDAARALLRLHAALTGGAPELVRSERLTDAARTLSRVSSSGPPGLPGTGRAATREIAARVRSFIHDAGDDVSLDDLGVAAGCTRYAAYRAFSTVYGMPPSDYQRLLRLRTARRLLASGLSPAVAAADAGFADQAHLTRWFRRIYGITPGVYQAAS